MRVLSRLVTLAGAFIFFAVVAAQEHELGHWLGPFYTFPTDAVQLTIFNPALPSARNVSGPPIIGTARVFDAAGNKSNEVAVRVPSGQAQIWIVPAPSAGGGHGHLDFLKQVGDPATAPTPVLVLETFAPSNGATRTLQILRRMGEIQPRSQLRNVMFGGAAGLTIGEVLRLSLTYPAGGERGGSPTSINVRYTLFYPNGQPASRSEPMTVAAGETGFWEVRRDELSSASARVPLLATVIVTGLSPEGSRPFAALFVLDQASGEARLAEGLPEIAGNFDDTAE